MDVPLKGNLRDRGLAGILMALEKDRATGTLLVSTPDFTKSVYIKDGKAIFASSTLEDDRLGEMLVKAGKISIKQYDKSVELLKTTGKRQGAILVELGYISPKDLFWGVKYQVKEIICGLFGISEGIYEFRDGISASDEVITLRISTQNLIYEGIKRLNNLTMIKKEIPSPEIVFSVKEGYREVSPDAFGFVDLSAEDRRILSLIDGTRTVGHLIEETQMNSFEVMKTVYALWTIGIIEREDAQEPTVDLGEMLDVTEGEEGKEAAASGLDEGLRRKVDELYEGLGVMGPDEILGIDENAGAEEIRRSYYKLAREFHPDKIYYAGDGELKHRITSVFDAVTKAYKLLQDEEKRREYFSALGKGKKAASWGQGLGEETSPGVAKDTLIKEQFQRAVEDFKKGDFWGASEIFKWIVKEDPGNPRAWSHLSLALSKIPGRLKEAEVAILEASRLEPFKSDHIVNLGLIYLKAGLKTRAKKQFERALQLDPKNEKARKGLEQAE